MHGIWLKKQIKDYCMKPLGGIKKLRYYSYKDHCNLPVLQLCCYNSFCCLCFRYLTNLPQLKLVISNFNLQTNYLLVKGKTFPS